MAETCISNDIGSVTYVLIHTARGGKPPNREVWGNPREQRTGAPGKPKKKKKKKMKKMKKKKKKDAIPTNLVKICKRDTSQ